MIYAEKCFKNVICYSLNLLVAIILSFYSNSIIAFSVNNPLEIQVVLFGGTLEDQLALTKGLIQLGKDVSIPSCETIKEFRMIANEADSSYEIVFQATYDPIQVRLLTPYYLKKSDIILIPLNLLNQEQSLEAIYWVEEIQKYTTAPIIFVGLREHATPTIDSRLSSTIREIPGISDSYLVSLNCNKEKDLLKQCIIIYGITHKVTISSYSKTN